jgi:hypothetical protein
MTKKTEIKVTPEIAHLVNTAFEGSGGAAGLVKWAKTHPMEFYTQLYIKLLPFKLDVDVTVEDNGDAAAAQLTQALANIIRIRKEDMAAAEAAAIKQARMNGINADRIIDGVAYSRIGSTGAAIDSAAIIDVTPERIADATTNMHKMAALLVDTGVNVNPYTGEPLPDTAPVADRFTSNRKPTPDPAAANVVNLNPAPDAFNQQQADRDRARERSAAVDRDRAKRSEPNSTQLWYEWQARGGNDRFGGT